jgi:hypothetical protein
MIDVKIESLTNKNHFIDQYSLLAKQFDQNIGSHFIHLNFKL